MTRLAFALGTILTGLLVIAPAPAEAPAFDDEQLEHFLATAEIVDSEEIGSGITKPLRITLQQGGQTMLAAFKTVDIQNTRLSRWQSSGMKLNFTDNYRYERAAYLVDRLLGLDMVPVAVLRKIDGQEGAVVQWVSDAVNEQQRRDRHLAPPDARALSVQWGVMRVFDALIFNFDRNLANQLITTSDWKLHLIDHSRSFRTLKTLPESFEDSPVTVPRELVSRIQALDEPQLREKLRGLVSRVQIKALLARRDKILEKIEHDRREYGDAAVFADGGDDEP